MGRTEHRWDEIRQMPTVVESIPSGSRGVHESLLRAYNILGEVIGMLARGDSSETIQAFIRFAVSR